MKAIIQAVKLKKRPSLKRIDAIFELIVVTVKN